MKNIHCFFRHRGGCTKFSIAIVVEWNYGKLLELSKVSDQRRLNKK